jgi:hypothetical protein
MKYITRHSGLLFIFLTVLLIGASSFSTKNSDVKEFKIEFESYKGGLKANGLKGTAFGEIFFALRNYDQMPLDEFGTTIVYVKASSTDDNLADFEFTIRKVNDEYILVGKKGTTWRKLSFAFSENNKAIVDQNGVTVK